jgi:carbon monoxide dehydrogenase subunit G
MITFEHSIEIQRPVEAVFAFVSDVRHNLQWQSGIKEVHVTPDGPPAVGTKATQVGSLLGVKIEGTSEITALEPNRSLSIKGTAVGGASFEVTMRFEAVGSGTRLSQSGQMDPGGLFKLAGPLLAGQMKKQLESDAQQLKEVLEAQV